MHRQVYNKLVWPLLSLAVVPMLHGTIFNDDLQRNGLIDQSSYVQANLHCESSLKIVRCNINFSQAHTLY